MQQARLLEQPREIARPEGPDRQREKYDEEAGAVAMQGGRQASIHRKRLRQRRPAQSKGPRSERSRRRHRRTARAVSGPTNVIHLLGTARPRCKMSGTDRRTGLCHDTSFGFPPRARRRPARRLRPRLRQRTRRDADAGDACRRLRGPTAVQQLRGDRGHAVAAAGRPLLHPPAAGRRCRGRGAHDQSAARAFDDLCARSLAVGRGRRRGRAARRRPGPTTEGSRRGPSRATSSLAGRTRARTRRDRAAIRGPRNTRRRKRRERERRNLHGML